MNRTRNARVVSPHEHLGALADLGFFHAVGGEFGDHFTQIEMDIGVVLPGGDHTVGLHDLSGIIGLQMVIQDAARRLDCADAFTGFDLDRGGIVGII